MGIFPKIDKLWLATLTSNTSDAGSEDVLNVTINIDGKDVVDENFFQGRARGQGSLDEAEHTVDFDSAALANTSIRLGTRGGNKWRPQHIMLLGHDSFDGFRTSPFAMVTDNNAWLSTDRDEGHLSMPIPFLVSRGNHTTPLIRRLLLLVSTNLAPAFDGLTNDNIRIQIFGHSDPEQLIFDELIPKGGPQRYLRDNWHFFDVSIPFTRGVLNSIRLSTDGNDKWLPYYFFLFGLDTATGTPTEVVPLVDIAPGKWNEGFLSTDPAEGKTTVFVGVAAT
jgi:hypothetical protein